MSKTFKLGFAVACAAAWAMQALAQQAIQPSPAYQPHPVAGQYPAAPAVAPGTAAYPAQPAPQMTLAPAAYDAEAEEEIGEDEEGLYWVWGQKWPGLALGPKIGTTGLGLELVFGINEYLNVRGGFNYGSFTWNQEFGDTDYDMDITMTSFPLLLDVQPGGGHFRISAGLFIQPGTEADIDSTPDEPTQIGAHTYNPDTIGTLSGHVDVDSVVAPYLGIGFGNAVAEDQLLTFTLDLGVVFQAYDVSLTSDGAGMTAKLDTFREDVKKEEQNIQDDLDDWKIFPVLTLGLAWHF